MQTKRAALPRKSDTESHHLYQTNGIGLPKKSNIALNQSRSNLDPVGNQKNETRPKSKHQQENESVKSSTKPQNSFQVTTSMVKLSTDSLKPGKLVHGPLRTERVTKQTEE